MRCSKCDNDNREGRKFCANCGTPLAVVCAKCGAANEPSEKFCGECGVDLAPSTAARINVTPPDEARQLGERRHLTILFCDLVGSVTLAAQVDPEEWRATVAGYQRAASEAITRFGGEVARYVGDGIMAFFGYPIAHDNDAERAARAGLAILDTIAQLNQQPVHTKLAVRIGIDSGPVVVGAGTGDMVDAFGDAANIAARVQAAAEPGTVMISEATQRLVAGLFIVEDRGAQTLKGIERPVKLYRVMRPSGVRGRFEAAAVAGGLTRFVGREDELRSLISRWQRVLEGEGQVALIIGEAGIGKSRLLQRFHQQIAGTPHTWIEAGAGAFFQNTPFYPIVEMLRRFVGDTPVQDQIAALASRLTAVGLAPAEAIPLLAPLLSLPLPPEYPPLPLAPEQQRRRLLATLVEWVLGSAHAQPMVIAIEDLHWVDPSTLELIQLLVEQGATARLLLLYTARPEFRPPWTMRAHHMQITLNRLSACNVRTIIGEVAAQKALSDETIATVVERTGGVPLFVEELTRAVLESGDPKLTGSAIPATLHDSLMARLDRLGPAKEVIQVGAVIGSDFSYELLHAVHPFPEPELRGALRTLTDAELLYVRGIAPEATYQFKHALIRDAAYEALLKSRRKEVHLIVARTIDEQFPAIKEAHPEVLARHWTQAGKMDAAIGEWRRGADSAMKRGALVEAEGHFTSALRLLDGLPENNERDRDELGLQLGLGLALWGAKGWSHLQTHRAFTRAQELAEKIGDSRQLVRVLHGLAVSASVAGQVKLGQELAAREVQLAELAGDRALLSAAHYILGNSLAFGAKFAESQEHHRLARKYFDEADAQNLPMHGGNSAPIEAIVTVYMGFPDRARRLLAEAIETTGRRKSSYDLTFTRMCAATLFLRLRDSQALLEQAAELSNLAAEHPFFKGYADFYAGMGLLMQGQAAQGIARVRRARAFWESIQFNMTRALELSAEAQVAAHEGRIEDALALVTNALHETEEFLWNRASVLRLRADLLVQRDPHDLAIETAYREAIQFARDIEAKFEQLQSTTQYVRWLAAQTRLNEARTMLAPICNWFTEGFDTLALKEAKALLDELEN